MVRPESNVNATLAGRMRTALTAAMKRRDAVAVAALRSAIGVIDNAGAVDPSGAPAAGALEVSAVGVGATDVAGRTLTEDEARALLRSEIRERDDAAQEYHCMGNHDHGERLLAEAQVLRGVLNADT